MQRDPKLYLYDIKQAISAIGEFTAGKTLADYQNELMMRSAVERQVVIIAERSNAKSSSSLKRSASCPTSIRRWSPVSDGTGVSLRSVI